MAFDLPPAPGPELNEDERGVLACLLTLHESAENGYIDPAAFHDLCDERGVLARGSSGRTEALRLLRVRGLIRHEPRASAPNRVTNYIQLVKPLDAGALLVELPDVELGRARLRPSGLAARLSCRQLSSCHVAHP